MPTSRPERLGELFEAHAGALALYARQWCDAPEDVVQDAFVALARQASWPDRVVPWLYTVVRNAAISASRQTLRRRRREGHIANGTAAAWFDATDDRTDAAEAARLLAGLDDDVREVVVARVWGALTFDEIATLQRCSLTTAHRRFQTGIARLQERLGS